MIKPIYHQNSIGNYPGPSITWRFMGSKGSFKGSSKGSFKGFRI